MFASIGFKPPILSWYGQFMLLFREAFGSPDTVLLYGIGLFLVFALMLLCAALLKLSGNELLPAVYGAIVAASAPLFHYLFNEYLAEPTQFFVVCWFLIILCHSRSWDRSMVLAQLVWATSVTLLSKSSSPAYVVVPGFLACYFMFAGRDSTRGWNFHGLSNSLALASGSLAALATAAWYAKNYSAVKAHAMVASSGTVAAYWGKEDTYLNTMVYWLGAIRELFFPTLGLWLYLAVLLVGAFGFLSRKPFKVGFFDLCALVAITQLVLMLLLFSFSSNRVTRYLLALLPYFSLLGAWGLHRAGCRSFQWAVCLAMVSMWLVSDGTRPAVGNDLTRSQILTEIVELAFPESRLDGGAHSIIAIDPACRGDWLAPVPANYQAAKLALARGTPNDMNFHYFGGGFFGSSWDEAWKHLLATNPQSVFVLSPDSQELAKARFNKGLQGENRRKFYAALENRDLFHAPQRLSRDGSILVYYPTEKIAQLASQQAQAQKPVMDLQKTQQLFNNTQVLSIREPTGKVEWRDAQGILIHPGTAPTVLLLDMTPFGRQGTLDFWGWISHLRPELLE
jgi:hypothetical protein